MLLTYRFEKVVSESLMAGTWPRGVPVQRRSPTHPFFISTYYMSHVPVGMYKGCFGIR